MEDTIMKRFLIIAAMVVASVQLQASHLASEFNLRIHEMAWFTVTLDNQVFETPVNRFQLGHLEPGTHYLTVTRIDEGHCHPYEYGTLIFSGYIHIPAMSRVNAVIDRFGRFRINRVVPLYPPVPEPVVCQPVPVPAYQGMSDYEFDQLVHTISRLSFESSRMQVAKQALSANMVSSRQVAELVRMMTFESSKLELAKFAYRNTVDKQNYFIINDAFTFESSILDLNNFIYNG
jgi:hypothetical protein